MPSHPATGQKGKSFRAQAAERFRRRATREAAPTLPSGARGGPGRAVRRAHGAPAEGPGSPRAGGRRFEPAFSRAACGPGCAGRLAGVPGGGTGYGASQAPPGTAIAAGKAPEKPPAKRARDKLPRQRGKELAPLTHGCYLTAPYHENPPTAE